MEKTYWIELEVDGSTTHVGLWGGRNAREAEIRASVHYSQKYSVGIADIKIIKTIKQ